MVFMDTLLPVLLYFAAYCLTAVQYSAAYDVECFRYMTCDCVRGKLFTGWITKAKTNSLFTSRSCWWIDWLALEWIYRLFTGFIDSSCSQLINTLWMFNSTHKLPWKSIWILTTYIYKRYIPTRECNNRFSCTVVLYNHPHNWPPILLHACGSLELFCTFALMQLSLYCLCSY